MKKAYYPFCIQIELVQGCNRDCEFCATRGLEKKFYYASAETLAHTARLLQNFGYKGRILLAMHGEPTLHPHVAECIEILRRRLPDVLMVMFTNGIMVLRKPELLEKMFKAGLDTIMFDEYTDSLIGEQVMKIPGIQRHKVEILKPGVHIFERSGRKRVLIAPPIDGKFEVMSRKLNNHAGVGMKPTAEPLKKPCSEIFRDFAVRWDGGIALCCNDFRGEYPVTNIMKCKTFEQAYYHPRIEAARRRLMQKDRAFNPCAKCSSLPIRPGLLPDKAGQMKMPLPTEEDIRITEEKHEPMAVIRKREWEK